MFVLRAVCSSLMLFSELKPPKRPNADDDDVR
jgi:hypothetical protein